MKVDRTKREIAQEVLREAFRGRERVAIADVVKSGSEAGVSRRTLQRIASQLGVREVHNGPYGAFWEKSEQA